MKHNHSLKKSVIKIALASIGLFATATPVLAKTVYYKKTPVYWDYGNIAKIRAYSKVQSHVYSHTTTVNGVSSGWKKKGVLAQAETWISPTKNVEAYWDCK